MNKKKQTFKLLPAKAEDMASIEALIHKVDINPYNLDWQRFIVAWDREKNLVGCGQVKLHRDGTPELASIAVEPAYRGQGIARAVIERLLKDHPYKKLYVFCPKSLERMYNKFGFEPCPKKDVPPYLRTAGFSFRLLHFFFPKSEKMIVMVRNK